MGVQQVALEAESAVVSWAVQKVVAAMGWALLAMVAVVTMDSALMGAAVVSMDSEMRVMA